jgi:hypothetical protein
MFNLLRVFGLLTLAGGLLGCGSKTCAGAPVKYSCIVGGCDHDVVVDPICSDGTYVCPSGSVAQSTCGGCFGLIPPNCACGDGGITCTEDAAAGQ